MNVQALHDGILSGWNLGALARGFAFHDRRAWSAAAAILSQEAEQRIHRLELGGVDHRPAVAAHRDKPGGPEPIEMKGQGIRREIECCSDGAGRHALGTSLHQQAEYIEPIILSESGQGRDGICLFHISANIEMIDVRQEIF
jgi:hypothetical protein